MKKMLIFGGIIIALFVAIFAVTQMEEKNATSQKIDNPTESKTNGPDYYTNKISFRSSKELKREKRRNSILLSNILRSLPKIISCPSANG